MYSESSILFREFAWGDENTARFSDVTFGQSTGLAVDTPLKTRDRRKKSCNGANTMKRIGPIQTTALVLLLGIGFRADARQDKPDRQEEKAKPGNPEKQAKPERQKQDKSAKP